MDLMYFVIESAKRKVGHPIINFQTDICDINFINQYLMLIKDLYDLKIKALVIGDSLFDLLDQIDTSAFYISCRAVLPKYPPLIETYRLRYHCFTQETVKYKQEQISLGEKLGEGATKFLNRHIPTKSLSFYRRMVREHAADHILLNQNNQEGIRIN